MVASNCWPLGKKRPEFTIKMVNVPVFGPAKGVPFPRFGIELKEGEDKKSFAAMVEDGAREIVVKITDKEYLERKAVRGTMPRLNRVLEELGIHHEEHKVPTEVLAMIEEKKKKATAKNTMAAAESKKRKGIGASKVVTKKQKISMAGPSSAASSVSGSARASTDAVEVSAENSGGAPAEAVAEAEKIDAPKDIGGQRVEGANRPKPSAVNPMPGVLGGDSSSSEDAGDAGHGGALPSDDAEARDGSRLHPVSTFVLEVSEDEAESWPPSAFRSVAF
jgi:hypothetical protein